MKGLLVDTSVWIDYFNGVESAQTDLLHSHIKSDFPIFLCPPVLQEILQGFRDDRDYSRAKTLLLEYPILTMDPVGAAIGAADIYRKARKKGKTVRKSTDCLIACHAVFHGVPILQKDRDFPLLADVCGLKVVLPD